MLAVFAMTFGRTAHAQSAFTETVESRLQATRKAIEQYEASQTTGEILSDELLALARLKMEKTQMLMEGYQPNQAVVDDELKLLEKVVATLGKIRGPIPLRPGLHEMAYIAENDRSAQPYLLYLPKSWAPDRPTPLFIFLHGYASYLDKVNWIELMYSPDLEALMDQLGFILLMPFGRSNTEFMGIGETDVLHTIELVRQRCKIDENGIFMTGASMGGSGAYTIACHHPDLFAGVMAIAGRYDYYLWKNLDPEQLAGFKRIQTDVDYARALLPNLRNVHTFIFHGSADTLVQPEQSHGLFKALSALGFSVTFREFPEESHWIWGMCFGWEPFAKWLSETRRDPNPKIVEYQTYSLKYNRAYWVTINDVELWGTLASVRAEVLDGNAVAVQSANVASLSLNLSQFAIRNPQSAIDSSKAVSVRWNGKEEQRNLPPDGIIKLGAAAADPAERGESRARLPDTLRKTPDLCGPAREALNGQFLFVYGTGGTEATRTVNQEMAVEAGRNWQRFSAGRARLRADAKVTEQELKENNLILIGAPDDNSLIARLGDSFPIKWPKGTYLVGHKSFPAEGNGLLAIYPSPFAPNRYVLVNSGKPWGEGLSINHKWDFLPDFIVYSGEKDWDDNNKYLCAGYFDRHWQLDDSLIWLGQNEKDAQITK